MSAQRLLIGYDGSADARNAIEAAARAIDTGTALVITVWQVIAPAEAVSPLAAGVPPPAVDPSTSERVALSKAREGADLARAAGFASQFGIRTGSGAGEIAEALLDAADTWNADLVVVGRRDMSRLREIVIGSVSDAVVRGAARPVLVVPAGISEACSS